MDEHVDGLIANLMVLASVPSGGRLSIRHGQMSVDTLIHGQSIVRMWHQDSRISTVRHVKNTLAGAQRATNAIMATASSRLEWNDRWTLERLARELERAEIGLRNLRSTYAEDASVMATLQVLSERMRAHADLIQGFLESRPQCALVVAT